jgi:hypothetical protein
VPAIQYLLKRIASSSVIPPLFSYIDIETSEGFRAAALVPRGWGVVPRAGDGRNLLKTGVNCA